MADPIAELTQACDQARRELNAEPSNPFVAGCLLISKTLQACVVAMLGGSESEASAEKKHHKAA